MPCPAVKVGIARISIPDRPCAAHACNFLWPVWKLMRISDHHAQCVIRAKALAPFGPQPCSAHIPLPD
eukprot:1141022-Pelagomonas_calceolata.AAC.6